MASKFSEFLKGEKIDIRRVAMASRKLEKLRVEDRAVKLKQRQSRAKEGGAPAPTEGETKAKPRSGRPATPQLLSRAVEGSSIAGPAKTRLLRAVNHVLEQKKKEPVDLRKLF